MSELNDFAIEIDRSCDEVYRRVLEDCELPKDILVAFKQQFSRYAGGRNLKRFDCQHSGSGLIVEKPILYRNSFALQMNLEFAVRENTTKIICRFRVHALVKVFMLVFAAPLIIAAAVVAVVLTAGLFDGTKTISDLAILGAFPLFGGFLAAMYFGGRKISESNAVEMKNWLLILFPHRMVNIEE